MRVGSSSTARSDSRSVSGDAWMTSAASSGGRRRIQERRSPAEVCRMTSDWSRAGSASRKSSASACGRKRRPSRRSSGERTGHASWSSTARRLRSRACTTLGAVTELVVSWLTGPRGVRGRIRWWPGLQGAPRSDLLPSRGRRRSQRGPGRLTARQDGFGRRYSYSIRGYRKSADSSSAPVVLGSCCSSGWGFECRAPGRYSSAVWRR